MKRRKAEFAVQVAADTTRATVDMDRFRVDQEARPVKIRTEVDRSGLDQITKGLGDAGAAFASALPLNLGAAGVGTLPALAAAITTVAGSIQQLAGAGLVLPGVFAAAAGSLGTAKLAVMGVSDAFKAVDKASDGSAKNVQAANEALAKLAPNAADFVKSVESLKPAFQSLQKDVQGKFFAGLGTEIRDLARADLPLLQKGLGGIATAFNQNLKQLGGTLGSAPTQGILDRILGNTGNAQARLSKAIDPIINAFGTLAAAGSDTLPRLADGVGKLADRFDHFILAAADSGKLSKWINDGITGFDHLGNTLLNIGKIVTDLTGAAGGGGGLLKWLDDGSTKLERFLSSTQGQETLRKFFADGREELKQLLPILENLGPVALGAFQAARDATGIWLPVIKEATDVLSQDPGLIRLIADAFLAWKFVGVITGVVDALKGITVALGLIGPAAATAGAEGAAGLAPLETAAAGLAANPVIAALLAAGLFGAGIGPLLNAGPDAAAAKAHEDFVKDYNATKGVPVPAVIGPVPGQIGPIGPGSGPQFAVSPPPVAPGSVDPHGIRRAGPTYIPPTSQNPFAGGYAAGGPTPSGRGNGPTGGWISELHGNEWVLPAHARAAVGDKALWALTGGRSFAPGGYIDQFGNPITPGAAPGGPAPIAPASGGGGIDSIAGSFLSGIGGPIGNIAGLIQGGTGGKPAASSTGAKLTPGFAGLAQAGNNPNLLNQWGTQTGDWLGNFGAKTLTSFATTLWSGALGFFGLQNSILSPSNPWFQAGSQTAGFFLGQNGPFGGQGSSSAQTVAGSTSLPDASHHGGPSKPAASTAASPASLAALSSPSSPSTPGGVIIDPSGAVNYKATYSGGGGSGGGVEQWRPVFSAVLTKLGLPQEPWLSLGLKQMQTESGGNPTIQNNSDSNAAKGTPSIGLMQVIGPTFAANLPPGFSNNITDPASNIAASIIYTQKRYGGPSGVWGQGHGYSVGGAARGPGGPTGDQIPAMLSNNEHVFTAADVAAMGGQGAVYAFRRGLHRQGGGEIKMAVPWGVDPIGGPGKSPSAGPFRPWWDMDWMPPEHPERVGPGGEGWWWHHGPTHEKGISGGPLGPPIGKHRKPLPGDFYPGMFPDDRIKQWGAPGFADGGEVTGLIDPRRPFPRPPEARQITPRPAAPAPSTIGPPQLQPPPPVAAPAPPEPPVAAPPQQPQQAPGAAPVAPPASTDHLLPAVSTGITSGFAAAGNVASAVASAFGGGAGGAGGSLIAGAFQQLGKIATGVANVGASFLVGSVPGSFGDPNLPAGGQTLRPAQRQPQTAPLNQTTWNIQGVDHRTFFDEVRLREAQDAQALLATSRG